VCGAYSHVSECCAVVVVVLCRNQIPINKDKSASFVRMHIIKANYLLIL